MEKTVKITFCGGTGSVTGSNFLLEVEGKKILVDCGLNQGTKLADDINVSLIKEQVELGVAVRMACLKKYCK